MLTCSVQICLLLQLNLCNPITEFSEFLLHPTRIYGPKVFLLTEIKPEYSDMLYNTTHFSGSLVCWIRKTTLYIYRERPYQRKHIPFLLVVEHMQKSKIIK